ncbi:hypothetical protein JTE90_003999 [Oedothorax gibbosus]|uniref:Growth arrest-specific protein 1 n=1 Tax=Oedothorax gibbosus TaxID=931172 RepID=A0AAV6UBV5_9ARAC|nr:hypothetical protein JTE90_003999 [Oedothorax gibbosus]
MKERPYSCTAAVVSICLQPNDPQTPQLTFDEAYLSFSTEKIRDSKEDMFYDSLLATTTEQSRLQKLVLSLRASRHAQSLFHSTIKTTDHVDSSDMMLILLLIAAVHCGANTLPGPQDCELARAKCAYRAGCYKALHAYMVGCADVLTGRTARCPFSCQRALISLTSTEYGLALSTCDCGDNEFCRKSKERIEVCRPEVSHATADNTVVSCSVAKWICAADTLCSTALDFYHRLCRPMFHGRKCTPRCNNSLAILDRQEKAGKLRDCYCDGSEDFPCYDMKRNTDRLCYGRVDILDRHFPKTATARPGQTAGSGPSSGRPANVVVYLLKFVVVGWCQGISRSGLGGGDLREFREWCGEKLQKVINNFMKPVKKMMKG